ncbi:hypothetical protein GGR90_002766 [Sphingopyxis italica]|uniref:Uncharacterized protein n=1 Tax=Sphingopyxis italica TaxID=1129133 RepID=A0A7X6BA73_9SPHN|nr:hypothetical protein [Sphingopyxis italica]NJB90572.1 hypothetical protein [Sphingopyxis italica]
MCDPVLGLTIASAAVTSAGQIQGGIYASQMSRYKAQVAEQNKQASREAANDAIVRGQEQQRQLGRDVAARVGAQEARMGANNIDPTFGSASRVILDTEMIGAEDSAALSENNRREVRARAMDAWNYESESRAARAESKQAKVAAGFAVASTLLGSATQYSRYRSQQFG